MSTSRCSSGRRAASAQLVMVWSPQKKGQVQWPGTACIVYLPGGGSSWRRNQVGSKFHSGKNKTDTLASSFSNLNFHRFSMNRTNFKPLSRI
jgi:hypothetical protein